MSTVFPSKPGIERNWHVIDANDVVLGKLASHAARILMGKHKTIYTPFLDTGDHVIVINAEKIELGGDKWDGKIYYRHSGFPGGLRTETAREVHAKHPERLIERAVRGMLATNRTRAVQLNRLTVIAGDKHPHEAQKPAPLF